MLLCKYNQQERFLGGKILEFDFGSVLFGPTKIFPHISNYILRQLAV